MPYVNQTTLIARPIRSGMGGVLDSIESLGSKVLNFYGQGQQAQGAANVLTAQNQALAAQQAGPSMTTILLFGALGIGAVMLLKKKKSTT